LAALFKSPEWEGVRCYLLDLAAASRAALLRKVTKLATIEGTEECKRALTDVGRIEASEFYAGERFMAEMLQRLKDQREAEAKALEDEEEDGGQRGTTGRRGAEGGVRRRGGTDRGRRGRSAGKSGA